MPNRLHDTEIWDKEWFRKLTSIEKNAFLYIKDKCDCVGVWNPDYGLAEFQLEHKIDWKELIKKCNGNIEKLDNGKLFITEFCAFQYGDFTNRDGKMYEGYRKRLKAHGLYERVCKGFGNTLASVQSKSKDKDKSKDKRKEKDYAPSIKMKEEDYKDLCYRFGKAKIDVYIEKISDYLKSTGKRYKDIPATIKNWMRRDANVDSVKALEINHAVYCKCGKDLSNEIKNGKSRCMSCDAEIKARSS